MREQALAGITQFAGAGEPAVDRTRPVGREVTGIEAGQGGVSLPFDERRPRHVADRIQPALRHRRAQRVHAHAIAIAGAGHVHGRAFVAALQPRLAFQRPRLRLAGDTEIGIATDRGLAVLACPPQAACVDRELQRGIVRILQVGDAIRCDATVEEVDHQRLQLQLAFDQAQLRRLDSGDEVALLEGAAQVGVAAGAARIELQRHRFAGFGAGEQADVERFALCAHLPARRVLGPS